MTTCSGSYKRALAMVIYDPAAAQQQTELGPPANPSAVVPYEVPPIDVLPLNGVPVAAVTHQL